MKTTMEQTLTVPASLPVLTKPGPMKLAAIGVYLAVALPLFLLGSFVASKSATLLHGQNVCIQASLFDPRDMFRGDYLQLTFTTPDVKAFANGQQVYVLYAPAKDGSGVWTPASASATIPKCGPKMFYLKGTVDSSRSSVEYPFARAFIPENTGNTVGNPDVLKAQLVIDGKGDAILANVTHKGAPLAKL